MASLRRNIALNFLGQGVAVAAPILALPWYLAGLGIQQWGLVGFVSALVTMLGILETGVGQGLVREFSVRLSSPGGQARAAALLAAYERLYLGFAVAGASIGALLAGPLSRHWLHMGDLPLSLGYITVYGASLLFAVQFPGFLYRSALMARNQYGALNILQAAAVALRHLAGALLVLRYHQLWQLLASQIVIALLETLWRRQLCAALRAAPGADRTAQWHEIRTTLRSAVMLSGAVIIGVLTLQLDKILLSRQVPLEAFGFYTIASTLALGVLQAINPVAQAALPRVAVLQEQPEQLRQLNRRLAGVFGGLTLLAGVVYWLAGHPLLAWWLRSPSIADAVAAPLDLLLIGSALNACYSLGYLNWLGSGSTRPLLLVSVSGMVLAVVALPILVDRYGISGASVSWIGMNLFGLIVSTVWMLRHRRL